MEENSNRFIPEKGFEKMPVIPKLGRDLLGPSKELWVLQVPVEMDLKSLSGSLKLSKQGDASGGALGNLRSSDGTEYTLWEESGSIAQQCHYTAADPSGTDPLQLLKVAKRVTVTTQCIGGLVETASPRGAVEAGSREPERGEESPRKGKKKSPKSEKKTPKSEKKKKKLHGEMTPEGSKKKKQKSEK
ncbi:hypothetical protein CYMTET_15635 [Cymbomonas tetramitiformis]|uniref:Uncharacterized protein n=1 Tax=Cymbomonas tetramitiformis TaxID=36881 RepID=A0AAE0GE65_9CHLO|nr:hypothetical protein CYMTET_15635 [Cymbomonas tetramitiformis]